jgi:hypothetical protein
MCPKVLAWESRQASVDRGRAVFFSCLDGTGATTVAQKFLIEPTLADARRFMEEAKADSRRDRFPVSELVALSTDRYERDATELLRTVGADLPTVLFSMSHGAGAPKDGWPSGAGPARVAGWPRAAIFGGPAPGGAGQ